MPRDQPSHGPSEDLIRATDLKETARHTGEFDNQFFDLKQWNLTESREIEYDYFNAVLRILEFQSKPTKLKEVDEFESLSFILIIKEKKKTANTRLDPTGNKPGAVLH
jgi:hypothetical protein